MARMINRWFVPDPAPPQWGMIWEELTKDQRNIIIAKQIDQQIKATEFQIESLKADLANLQSIKAMIKEKV